MCEWDDYRGGPEGTLVETDDCGGRVVDCLLDTKE